MKYLLKFLKKPKIIFLQVINLITVALSNASSLAIPALAGQALDLFNQGGIEELNSLVYLLAGIIVGSFIIDLIQKYLDRYLSEVIGFNIKNALIDKLNKQTYTYVHNRDNSKLLTVLTGDVDLVRDFLSIWVTNIIGGILLFFGAAFLAYRTSPRIAIYIYIAIPIIVGLFTALFMSLRKLFDVYRKKVDKLNKKLNENIKASMLIRVLNAQNKESKKFRKSNKSLYNNALKITNIYALVIPIATMLSTLIMLLVVRLGGENVIDGSLTVGDLTQLIAYVSILTSPVLMAGMLFTAIGNAIAAGGRISNVLKAKIDRKDGKRSIETFKSLIFKDVSLNLSNGSEDETILQDISFSFNQGESLGMIGATGSGKSILLSLILRLRDSDSGEILLNDTPISKFKIADWRELIGFVPQDSLLFSGTIRENLTLGENISEEKLIEAAKTAQIHQFISNLENGFNSEIGEFGINLSGGQKQRIALVRALLRKPQILILDDASSKLDVKTESKILKSLKKQYPETSLIVVSQKIMSIQNCDQILVLEQGEIEDKGKHDYLEDNSFTYRQLMLSQL